MAVVSIAGYEGYIDKRGHLVVPAQYEWANEFRSGLAEVATAFRLEYDNPHTGAEEVVRVSDFAQPIQQEIRSTSTYAGMAGLATAFGLGAEDWQTVSMALAGIAGVVAILLRENSSPQ